MHLSLDWHGDLTFKNSAGSPAIELQSSAPGISSPPQALAYALMACMGMDVVHVLEKGRHDFRGLTIKFEGERAAEHPRRFLTMRVLFEVVGRVDSHIVERAVELSRVKYCTVWNTIRQDTELVTHCNIREN